MLAVSSLASLFPRPVLLADAPAAPLLAPVIVLLLCVVAGVGTVLLLPGRREGAIRKVGGAILLLAGLVFAALIFRAAAGESDASASYYFWPFAAVALFSGVRVITHPRPVYSALYFVLTTFASAGLFVLLWAEFMAAALILIYAGAILVTYVFVIMLAQQATTPGASATAVNEYDVVAREPIVASAVGFALMAVLLFVITDRAVQVQKVPEAAAIDPQAAPVLDTPNLISAGESTKAVGSHLFKYHMVNLELAGLILTLATVGAIIIARRRLAVGTVAAPQGMLTTPNTPIDDNPHSIPVYGTDNPRQKEYPET